MLIQFHSYSTVPRCGSKGSQRTPDTPSCLVTQCLGTLLYLTVSLRPTRMTGLFQNLPPQLSFLRFIIEIAV